MADLILTTFDRAPETPRGYVRDIRVRWALEEAELSYRVESVLFGDRSWSLFKFPATPADTPGRKHLDAFLSARLQHIERFGRTRMAGRVVLHCRHRMVDVLRLVDRWASGTSSLS
jgi:glutathione S-transferase